MKCEAFLLADAAIRACALLTKQKEAYGYYGTMGVRLSIYNKNRVTQHMLRHSVFVFQWSWRGSNPRPNREPIGFLHVYSRLHCRASARPGPPTDTVSSKTSSQARGAPKDYSRNSYTAEPDASEQELLSDVSSQHLVPRLGQ